MTETVLSRTWRCETHGLSGNSCCGDAYVYANESLATSATELLRSHQKLGKRHANLSRKACVWRKQIRELQRALECHRDAEEDADKFAGYALKLTKEVGRLTAELEAARATILEQGKRLAELVDARNQGSA